ncbi:MAG: hypothetical protein ACREDK_09500 [Thermoplasmata archaeon]
MSAGSRGTGAGIVIGLASTLLAQQLGFVDLGPSSAVIYLVLFTIAGALIFGLIGRRLGRRHAPEGVKAWTPAPNGPDAPDENAAPKS